MAKSPTKQARPPFTSGEYGSIHIHNVEMLLPSPSPTDLPSSENLLPPTSLDGYYNDNSDSESNGLLRRQMMGHSSSEIQLSNFGRSNSKFEDVFIEHVTGRHVRTRNLVLVGVCVVIVGAIVFFWNHSSSSINIPFPHNNNKPIASTTKAFSTLDPVADLGLPAVHRPDSSLPPPPLAHGRPDARHYPTNAWYQNLLMAAGEPEEAHRAYSIPYVVDATGPVPGLRVHPNHIDASSFVVQLNVIAQYGLTLGATADAQDRATSTKQPPKSTHTYKATHTTPLGVTLEWNSYPMHSSITKGMPYATMRYQQIRTVGSAGETILPSVVAEIPLAKNPTVDGGKEAPCHSSNTEPFRVERELELVFEQSDFTWLVFVSEPVLMQCVVDDLGRMVLQVVEWAEEPETDRDLVMRVALLKLCSTGAEPVWCHQEKMHPTALLLGQGHYGEQLRKHANHFPGRDTSFDYSFNDNNVDDDDESGTVATLKFDWNAQDMSEIALHPVPANKTAILGFALPHHFDIIVQAPPADHDIYCVSSLIGPACLYEGSVWELKEVIPKIGFRASRPPAPWSIPSLASSLSEDVHFNLPDYYQRGAGDTYFSGKMLAKLARILLVAEEVEDVCSSAIKDGKSEYAEACRDITLPSQSDFDQALDRLRSNVEIWINGTAETPFVFDSAWGGAVSCGCLFNGKHGSCDNTFPEQECPAFNDPGLNFGNAFYNDVHFHYGYFIHAAAVVSHFDPVWGRKMFEQVLLLIRVIASPEGDDFFPPWRHKDWFQGHSWASGIAVSVPNGKNQESSSEAIAAYEAIALYGSTMTKVWEETRSRTNLAAAKKVERAGQLLTATELRSARQYYHVMDMKDLTIKIYPSAYTPRTIGIMWQTMAQCQTWFGSAPYLAYGIQLLPLTPVAEHRDTISWAKGMYHIFAESCSGDPGCEVNGWSILQLAMLARVGHQQLAAELTQKLPSEVFDSAGGDGHSLSNALWFCATRETLDKPLALTEPEQSQNDNEKTDKPEKNDEPKHEKPSSIKVTDCGQPDLCTDFVLDTIAGLYTCRQRMDWLMQQMGRSEEEACTQIAVKENPWECGACNPNPGEVESKAEEAPKCPECTLEQCQSELNRCPLYKSTFVCTDGDSRGGCSSSPWNVHGSQQCRACCELTRCPKQDPAELRAENEAHCPPCSRAVCRGSVNQCPAHHGSQYLCIEGASTGGCSLLPWTVGGVQCKKCCNLLPGCDK